MPVVKTDVKTVQILFTTSCNVGYKLLRRFAGFFSGDHDGGAVGVVCAYKIHRIALHALKPHPNISLDVLHDVADVEVAVGVGERRGDEKLAGRLLGSGLENGHKYFKVSVGRIGVFMGYFMGCGYTSTQFEIHHVTTT